MAYAELWQPINGAISNLNQTINTVANREDRRAAQGLQSILQLDSLEGTAFDRRQRKAAGERAERQLELQQEQQSFSQRQAEAAAARQAEHDRLVRPVLELQQKEAEEKLLPKDVNFYNFLPQDPQTEQWAFKDTEAAKRMATIIGGDGAQWDAQTRNLVDRNGNPIKRTGFQLKSAAPGIHGIVTAYSDPLVQQDQYVSQLQADVDDKRKIVQQFKKGHGTVDRSQRLAPQIKQAESDLHRAEIALEREKGKKPWKLIENYEKRQRVLDAFTAQYAFNGGEPQALTVLLNSAKENSDLLQNLRKQKYDALYGDTKELLARYAMKMDDKGNVLETRIISAPKTKQGVLPEDVDERLLAQDGWVWGEHVAKKNMGAGGSGSNNAWVAGFKMGERPFTKEGPAGQFILKPGMGQAHSAYGRLYEKFYEDTKNPMTSANKARDTVVAAETGYWGMVNKIASEFDLDPIEDRDLIHERLKSIPFGNTEKIGKNGEGSFYNSIEEVLEYIPDNPHLNFN